MPCYGPIAINLYLTALLPLIKGARTNLKVEVRAKKILDLSAILIEKWGGTGHTAIGDSIKFSQKKIILAKSLHFLSIQLY